MKQLTKAQAIALAESKVIDSWTNDEIVKFQLFQDRLCMSFSKFHEAVSNIFKRPVFTHEFAYRDELIKEYLGEKEPPTFEQIINLIPEEKRILIKI